MTLYKLHRLYSSEKISLLIETYPHRIKKPQYHIEAASLLKWLYPQVQCVLKTFFHSFILFHIRHFYLTLNVEVLIKALLMPIASRNNLQIFLTPPAVIYL